MKKLLATLLLASTALFATARPTVLSIKETIHDNAIVAPESFETNTEELKKNWYLQNFTILDEGAELKNDIPTSKEDYIERLQALPTVIEMPYNDVVRSYINMYTQKRRGLVEQMLGLSLYYMPFFEQALEQEGLPLELKYLPVIESALNPDAVSPVGATGLWQFMLGTAKQMNLTVNSLVDERRDPIRSSEAAAKLLKQLYNIYGDWALAIASYNCGPGNVNKALRRAGGGKRDFWEIYFYLPRETRGYVPAFIAANYVMNYYEDHNIGKALAKRPISTDTVMVNKYLHFNQISEVLNIPIEELRILNPQYRKDIIPGNARPYTLTLPSKQIYSYIVSEDTIVKHKANLYAHRSEVQIAESTSGNSEWQTVTKYHKVRKGETLSKIARKYGVTTSSIKKWNGLRKNTVKRGTTLKIKVKTRVPKKEKSETKQEDEKKVEVAEEKQELADNTKQETEKTEEVAEEAQEEVKEQPQTTKKYHKVRKGESLTSIARKYGVSVTQLKRWNKIKSSRAKVGKTLVIYTSATTEEKTTPAKQKYHTVKRGETLSSIADTHGVTISQIKEWNAMDDDVVNVGEKLAIDASVAKKATKKKTEKPTSTYKVKSGDTLGEIAAKFGTTVNNLKGLNGLSSNTVHVGQVLKVSGKASAKSSQKEKTGKSKKKTKTHTVKSGESLGVIAEKYGTTASAIRRANGIKGNLIKPGQKLVIPSK